MGFIFQRRLNLGSGLGLNLSKSGASPSVKTKFGTIGAKGYSIRSGIPGFYFRKRWGKKSGILDFLIFGVILLGFYLLWELIKFVFKSVFFIIKILYEITKWIVLTVFDLLKHLTSRTKKIKEENEIKVEKISTLGIEENLPNPQVIAFNEKPTDLTQKDTIYNNLKNFYEKKSLEFRKIHLDFPDDDLAGPFLMSPNELFDRQPLKLMVIGQETNGWTYHSDNISQQMKSYKEFNLGIKYYASPFWNVIRKLEKAVGNKEYSCAWTNINKFDLSSDRPYGKYLDAISQLDYILLEEINILQPEICIFFTGPDFDDRLMDVFDSIELEEVKGWEKRQFAKLKHKNLPPLSFRTYHPNYLRRSGLETTFIKYMKSIEYKKVVIKNTEDKTLEILNKYNHG